MSYPDTSFQTRVKDLGTLNLDRPGTRHQFVFKYNDTILKCVAYTEEEAMKRLNICLNSGSKFPKTRQFSWMGELVVDRKLGY